MARPSLLMLTAAAAAVATLANVVDAAMPPATDAAKTRLGVAVGQDLGVRDQAAIRRDRALDLREQAARATEARLKADLEARQQANAAPAAQAQQPDGKAADPNGSGQGDQYDDLARIYQAMKPAQAAIVFEQLELDVQMKVAQRMRDRSTAMILGAMTPKGAATLSMALARRYAAQPRPAGTTIARR